MLPKDVYLNENLRLCSLKYQSEAIEALNKRVALNSGLFIFLHYENCFSTENATDKKKKNKEEKKLK